MTEYPMLHYCWLFDRPAKFGKKEDDDKSWFYFWDVDVLKDIEHYPYDRDRYKAAFAACYCSCCMPVVGMILNVTDSNDKGYRKRYKVIEVQVNFVYGISGGPTYDVGVREIREERLETL